MIHRKLQGLVAAPFTTMNADGSLHLSVVDNYCSFLKRNGVTGAFINGSTGEGVSLTLQEKKKHTEAWAAATRDDREFKVIALAGGTCIADCIDIAQHARENGLYAVAFTAPFYFRPASAPVLAEACKTIADAVPEMSFYYYHIPVLKDVNIPMYDLLPAVDGQIENFAGIKYTHEDFMDFQSCMNFQNGCYDML